MTYLILLPHIPSLFMTTLIVTAGLRMTTHCGPFAIFKRRLQKNRTRHLFDPIPVESISGASSFRFLSKAADGDLIND